MKAFPFSLDGAAKDWLYLQPVLFNTWGDMKHTFLEKFFPTSRTTSIRKEICGIRQHKGETLHEYLERFNKLYAICPHHHINEQLLIQYFYEGALMDKTPAAARHLISNMANFQPKIGELANRIDIIGETACSWTTPTSPGSKANSAKTESGAICSSTIRIHTECLSKTSRLSTADSTISSTTFPTATAGAKSAYPRQLSIFGRPNEAPANSSLEFQQSVRSSNMQFQQNMTATIQDLKMQIGQLLNTVSQLQSTGSSNLPSQTIPNLRGNASAVTLRSGKELPQPTLQQLPRPAKADSEPNADLQSRPETVVPLPFPSRTISTKKPESDEELLKMFRKVEINIPLLDAIKQVPKYAKFLKELCVHKRRKIKGSKEIGGVVSALTKNEEFTVGTSRALPQKCRDPGIFSVPCTIGDCTFADAMLDLGASINVMPASIYRSLNFGDLEPTRMIIQLANRSIVQPLGVLEDVLVQVNELIFPTDFYVLDMEEETSGKGSALIMGRPFLMIAKTKIDVHVGTLLMEFGDTLVQFNIFEAMKHPIEDHSLFGIDLLDEIVEEYSQLNSSSEDIEKFVGRADEISCLGVADEEADHEEVQDLPYSEDNHSDIVDLDFEVELSELLDQVCNQEHSERTKDAAVRVSEIRESPIAQLATIFTVEIKSAREGQFEEELKVNSAEKSKIKADTLVEIVLANEDQTQAGVEITVPSGSGSKAAQEANADSDPTRTEASESSRPR
ncbi:hypothetical protein CR513_51013, partial [Mucuna pruriens]